MLGFPLRAMPMSASSGSVVLSRTHCRGVCSQRLRYSKRQHDQTSHPPLAPGQVHVWWLRPSQVPAQASADSAIREYREACSKPAQLQGLRAPTLGDPLHTAEDQAELSSITDMSTRHQRMLARAFLRKTLARQAHFYTSKGVSC